MKKVLVVSYHFLPVHNVGVKQFADYCHHLPESGWSPIVLSRDWSTGLAEEDAGWGLSYVDDTPEMPVVTAPYTRWSSSLMSLHERLGRATEHTAPPLKRALLTPARKALSALWPLYGSAPGEFEGWTRPAVEAGLRAIREHRVDAILSTCPPAVNHYVGGMLARRSGLPWVVYFGDLYSFYIGPGDWHGNPARRWLAKSIHRHSLQRAGRALAVSPRMARMVEKLYGVPASVAVVGYDERDFAGPPPPRATGKLRLAHAGSIYPDDQRPEMLFDALDRLIAAAPAAADEVEVVLVGSKCEERLRAMVAGRPCERVCDIHPKVSPAEAVRLQRASDVLLLLNLTSQRGRGTLSYPSKVFEYLAAARPVLAFPADGDYLDAVLRDTGGGTVADSVDELATTLAAWYTAWRDGRGIPFSPRADRVREFSRRGQTARIAAALDAA